MQSLEELIKHFRTWSTSNDIQYTSLNKDSDSCDATGSPPTRHNLLARQIFYPNIWFVTTFLFSAYSLWHYHQVSDGSSSSSLVPLTNLVTTSSASFGTEQRRFTGGLRDTENGTLYAWFDPDSPRYVGLPSPSIDQAWDDLLTGRYIRLSDEEVSILNQDQGLPDLQPLPVLSTVPDSGFYGSIDMLHTLHCVNALRKHLDIDYYGPSMRLPAYMQRMHMDHCIDQLRQAVLCHGDLTPVTLKPAQYEIPGTTQTALYLLGETERVHTCRKSEDIRAWIKEMGKQRGIVG